MQFIPKFYPIIFALFCASCVNLKKEFEVELPPVPKEFALTSYINVGYDTIAFLQIEKLTEIGTQGEQVLADIRIFKENELIYEQKNCSSENALNGFDLRNLQEEKTYTIEISDPKGDLQSCSASSFLYKKPEIGQITFQHNKIISDYQDYYDKVIIGIKDDPNLKNVYYVAAKVIKYHFEYEYDDLGNVIDSTIIYNENNTYSDDADRSYYNYVNDAKISSDGYIYVNRIVTGYSYQVTDSVIVEYIVFSVAEEEAKYSESIHNANNTDNPFAEPTSTFTNFKDGNGIFSMRNATHGKIKVKVK